MKKIVTYGMSIWILSLISCAGSTPNTLNIKAGPKGVSERQVLVQDKRLGRKLDFGEVSIKPLNNESGFEAQVMLLNKSRRQLSIEYRFIWYDRNGYEFSGMHAWIPKILGAKSASGVRSVSPGPDYQGFRFMVRHPKPLTDTGS